MIPNGGFFCPFDSRTTQFFFRINLIHKLPQILFFSSEVRESILIFLVKQADASKF